MSSKTSIEHNYGQQSCRPLHIQRLEKALGLESFLAYVTKVLDTPINDDSDDDFLDRLDGFKSSQNGSDGNNLVNGITITKAERKTDKMGLYNFSKVKKSRKWLKNILLSDSSSDEDTDSGSITDEDFQMMLKLHKYQKKHQQLFYRDPDLHQYRYYSTGLMSSYDRYYDHQKLILGPKKRISREQKKIEKKMKAKLRKLKRALENGDSENGSFDASLSEAYPHPKQLHGKSKQNKKLTPEQADTKRRKIWLSIAKKEIPKAQKQKASARKEMLSTLKKISQQCMKDCRRAALQSQKVMKETPQRAKRLTREMQIYWKRFEKVEKEHRKRAEKEAQEQRKMDLELREARRQQRKLNFLITQTELYAHFMARKMTGETEAAKEKILRKLDEPNYQKPLKVEGGLLVDVEEDDYDSIEMKNLALQRAEDAYLAHQMKKRAFDDEMFLRRSGGNTLGFTSDILDSSLANPAISTAVERSQPEIFEGKLKCYQLKGMNWLANLYDQGINGILADEMGLGKTVQSLAFLAHLSESQSIWGPFLIIAPASTLHNWQQECARFVPKFKVVPYWGNTQDRRILRKFWDQKCLHTEEASFHVVITSYQLVIQDVKYFQRIKWQYMVLDEAQAIKSSSSARWKTLLGFNCRNRLLLTGTPIQNSMGELWALLHFIMPTLFDSHEEFNEWFSKDIESHVERQSGIDENQLSRLHMILKPFMLRRVKKDVENELSDKIEILVYCPLTTRQRLLYQGVKNKISIDDLLHSSTASSSQAQSTTSSLMNLVMQFRKVCNHPELFERREVRSPFVFKPEAYFIPKLIYRHGILHRSLAAKMKILHNKLYIHCSHYIHKSLHSSSSGSSVNSLFSFIRFTDMSPQQLENQMCGSLLARWLAVFLCLKSAYRIYAEQYSHSFTKTPKSKNSDLFLLAPLRTVFYPNLSASENLQKFVFSSYLSQVYSHTTHVIHYMPETVGHRLIRYKAQRLSIQKKSPKSPTVSPIKKPALNVDVNDLPVHPHRMRRPYVFHCQPTCMPTFLTKLIPKMQVLPAGWYSVDRSAAWDRQRELDCDTLSFKLCLKFGIEDTPYRTRSKAYFVPPERAGLFASYPQHGWSGILVPDKETLVTDAGKLTVLDSLLHRLKKDGHRVLIYSQMTRMIDLLEEYMWHRKHTYMRLDGSSKISERRDMVADFQNRSDIFVFLLSTRAGGLGINLTAADTVIFYDSDWNPTVDQQAMDRAHRLGQTKQVTVYRLICKGTIEERILQRAKEKSEIQRMVISGGNFRPDTLKPKEVVSLLIDDDEMETKLILSVKQRQEEKRFREKETKERKRKREKLTEKTKDVKRLKTEDNVVIPVPDTDSVASFDSMSVPASPQSEMSVGSEFNQPSSNLVIDDNSNDAPLVVDDAHTSFPPLAPIPTPTKRGTGRSRGRPKGSGVGRRPRGRGTAKKALSAAEIAGAQAGMTAAYAAYGYNFTGQAKGVRGRGLAHSANSTPNVSPKSLMRNGTP
ncbi:chromatin-remodeling ATPase INO80-like [Octopus sinensis]|uniref:Chromatin-remodeling ATPase INO80 n=1 Tax=Octopus sinensis TaxID=2607531 RepID=A0A6P7SHB6_9MOLL|nr:chromatin-remodeling ATPase INO80-like [Octopus sinensis]XP_029637351.1 chromatin-remodeling ATPase INO80-like [Octopus sinensis]